MTFLKYTFACFIEYMRSLDVSVILKAILVAILSNLFHFTFPFLGEKKRSCFFTGFDVFVLKHEKMLSLCAVECCKDDSLESN